MNGMKFTVKSAGQYSNILSEMISSFSFRGFDEVADGLVKVTEISEKSKIVTGKPELIYEDEQKEIKPTNKVAQIDPMVRVQILKDLVAEKNKIDYEISKQKIQLHNAENQLTDQSQLLIIQMENTWNELNNTYQQIEIAINSIEQSTENLRLYNDYYNAGTCTMTDLLNAQTLYQQSCDQYIEAYANYEIKKREYLQMTGR